MDFVKLTLSFLLPLSLAGHLRGASIGSKVYPVQQSTIKNAFANDRPYSLRKRSRRLKLNKFSRVKICLNEECNYFKLLTRNSLIHKCSDQFISDTSNPELPVNLAGGPVHQFGFKERKVKRNSIRDNLIQLTDGNRFNVENYFSIEVQTTMPKNRKENHPTWKGQTEFEQSGNRHRTYPSDISHVNSFIKLGSSQVIGSHGGGVSKRDVVESRTDKMKTEDTEATSTPVKAEITKTGTVVCPTQDSGSGKKGNESRMPYDWDRDSYMALGSLTFLLLVLTCAVMYTGLWKKRNTMLYPDFIEHENTSTRHKTDIKALLKAKLGKIPIRQSKLRAKMKTKNHRNHHRNYHELPLVEDMEVEWGSGPDSEGKSSDEEEIYSNGRRNVKASSYY